MKTIGADPEVLISNIATGLMMPVCGMIGGTKSSPLAMAGLPTGFAVQEDNVMLEFNIPPVDSATDWAAHITSAMDYIGELIHTEFAGAAEMSRSCGKVYSAESLEHPSAQVFGCSPDFDAHSQGSALAPIHPNKLVHSDGAWRFSGGHVHLGYDNPANIPGFVVAALGDLFLGLPSIGMDSQGERRAHYGSAGRYRPTSYGIEYRVLSNFWLFDHDTTKDVGRRALRLCELIDSGMEATVRKVYTAVPWADVQRAINTENEQLAADILAFVQLDLGLEV